MSLIVKLAGERVWRKKQAVVKQVQSFFTNTLLKSLLLPYLYPFIVL